MKRGPRRGRPGRRHRRRTGLGGLREQVGRRACAAVILLLALCAFGTGAGAERSPYEWASVRLDYARREKVGLLQRYCDHMHGLARQAAQDKAVTGFFNVNLEYSRALANGPVPPDLATTVDDMRKGFEQYYIQHYLAFYDFLFVGLDGSPFYSLRGEQALSSDPRGAIAGDSPLAQCLNASPKAEVFVDFHLFGTSPEPAAFFIEPIRKSGALTGWLVLQCSITKVNTLFAWNRDLGKTGETFLVNHRGFMLTESNFEGASTILNKHLDDRNIKAKFAEGHGHRTVRDYRNCTALTSFEVVPFMGTRWLVVAKVDKDEITTDHYTLHRRYYADRLSEFLRQAPLAPTRPHTPVAESTTLRVDMDEFLKAGEGQRLETFGVSTCTCILGTRPGEFGYLAHISPRDRIYGQDGTNLLGQMAMRIKTFDIRPSEMKDVSFVIAATHLDSLSSAIDKLLEEGFLLSQVSVLYNPRAEYAQVGFDCGAGGLAVSWQMGDSPTRRHIHHGKDAVRVSEIVEQVMDADNEGRTVSAAAATARAGERRAL